MNQIWKVKNIFLNNVIYIRIQVFVLNLEKYQHGEIIWHFLNQHLQKRWTKANNCMSIKKVTVDWKKFNFAGIVSSGNQSLKM